MKWTLIFAISLAMITGCSKSNLAPEDPEISAQADNPNQKNNLVGKWRLIEYFQDRGDGTGHWVGATEVEEITFTESGEVMISSNSPLASRGYNRYRIVDANQVELYSTSNNNKEVYYYNRESDTGLLFNPQCRENCSRRYKLVG